MFSVLPIRQLFLRPNLAWPRHLVLCELILLLSSLLWNISLIFEEVKQRDTKQQLHHSYSNSAYEWLWSCSIIVIISQHTAKFYFTHCYYMISTLLSVLSSFCLTYSFLLCQDNIFIPFLLIFFFSCFRRIRVRSSPSRQKSSEYDDHYEVSMYIHTEQISTYGTSICTTYSNCFKLAYIIAVSPSFNVFFCHF